MIHISQLQRDNILSAKKMWNSVPERNVVPHLATWNYVPNSRAKRLKAPTCKTVACFGGWCAWWPTFMAQGIKANPEGAPVIDGDEDRSVSQKLFGFPGLFIRRGRADADLEFQDKYIHDYLESSDWKIVMNRIDHMLKNSVVTL